MLDLKLVRQNAELKSKDNSYTWIAPDRVIAMIDEIERLRTSSSARSPSRTSGQRENMALRAALTSVTRSDSHDDAIRIAAFALRQSGNKEG